MGTRDLSETWEALGKSDPLWAVLSYPNKRGGGWDLDEFLATGEREVDEALEWIESVGASIPAGRALDFGCGVGRLTQQLSRRLKGATGVDIAQSMVDLARRINREGERCEYVLNKQPDLRLFGDRTFSLVYSNITLQHMPPGLMERYLREFVRVVVPGGLLLVQIPAAPPRNWRSAVKRMIPAGLRVRWAGGRARAHGKPRIQMFWLRPKRVTRVLERAGAEVIAVKKDFASGPRWSSRRYLARRPSDDTGANS